MEEQQVRGVRFRWREWRWPLTALITGVYASTLLFVLILTGRVTLEQIKIGRDEGVLSIISGSNEEKYQDFLAAALRSEDYPFIEEVGIFLLINGTANVDGRKARNIGEICIALLYAQHKQSEVGCPPATFATIRSAIQRLETLKYLSFVTYFKDRFLSYELNALGELALSSVRRRWSAQGGHTAEKLGRLDLSYPGLLPNLIMARREYADAINRERGQAGP